MAWPLLRLTPLLPGESLPSLLARLIVLNHYETPAIMKWLGQVGVDRLACPEGTGAYERLATLTSLKPADLYAATVHRFAAAIVSPEYKRRSITLPGGEEVPAADHALLREHTRPDFDTQFCPLCLAERAYHRLVWSAQAAAICLNHQCVLTRGCPRCQEKLNIADVVKAQCPHCEFELVNAPVISVAADEFGLFSQASIQHWLGLAPTPAADYGLPKQSKAALYRVLDGLRRAVMMARRWDYLYQAPGGLSVSFFPCRIKDNITPTKAYILYATACKGLTNWPQGFYEFMDAYKRRDEQTPQGQIVSDLGVIYTPWLEKRWQFPLFDFVQEAFDQYLLDNYKVTPSLLHLRRIENNIAFRARFTYLTEADAARLLGTTGGMVKRLVGMGFLVSYQEAEKDALPQRFNLVRRAEVEELQQKWQGAVPLQEAAQLLGVSDEVVLEMVGEGLLEAVRGPNADGTPAWKLSYGSLTDFIARLQVSVTQYPAKQPIQPVSLVGAAQMLSVYGLGIVTILKQVLAGELRGYWPKEDSALLPQLVISRQDIETLIEGIRAKRPLLTRQQVANMLKVKIPTVTAWVKSGLLVPVEERRGGIYFDREAICSFIEEHLFAEEAAELLGVGVLAVQKWARGGRLQAASGPGVDGLHRYLFRREEVERLKPENRLTGPQLAKRLGISRSQLWVRVKQGKVTPVSGPGIDASKHYLFVMPQE